MSRLPMPSRRVREQEVLDAGVLVPGVVAVAQRVRLLAAGAADGVVAAAACRRRSSSSRCPRWTAARVPVARKMLPCAAIGVGRAVALGGVVRRCRARQSTAWLPSRSTMRSVSPAAHHAATTARAPPPPRRAPPRRSRGRRARACGEPGSRSSVLRKARWRSGVDVQQRRRRAPVGLAPPGRHAQRRAPVARAAGRARWGLLTTTRSAPSRP